MLGGIRIQQSVPEHCVEMLRKQHFQQTLLRWLEDIVDRRCLLLCLLRTWNRKKLVDRDDLARSGLEAVADDLDTVVTTFEKSFGQRSDHRACKGELQVGEYARIRRNDIVSAPGEVLHRAFADADKIEISPCPQLAIPIVDLEGCRTEDIAVERSGQTAIGCNHHQGDAVDVALLEQRRDHRLAAGKVSENLPQLLTIRSGCDDRILGATKLCRRYHLHRLCDLRRVLDPLDPATYLAILCHA